MLRRLWVSLTWGANDAGAFEVTLCMSLVIISTRRWADSGIWDRSPGGYLAFGGAAATAAALGGPVGGREPCGGPPWGGPWGGLWGGSWGADGGPWLWYGAGGAWAASYVGWEGAYELWGVPMDGAYGLWGEGLFPAWGGGAMLGRVY